MNTSPEQARTMLIDRSEFSRRQFLGRSIAAACTTAICSTSFAEERRPAEKSPGFPRYADLLKHLKARGHRWKTLGICPDGSPVVAVKAGGEKTPAIVISGGAHSTEHAGVVSAVNLIDELETEHQVYVLPCRDPIGLSGYRHALSLALGEAPAISTFDEAVALLREKGTILYDEKERLLVQIGEYGFANRSFYRKVEKGADFLEPLRGRRLWFPSNYEDAPGAAPLQRAYTQIVTPDGEVLHLNRFHDTPWAPVEVQCIRNLMAEVKPKLVFDCHEYGGDDFWMSARRQQTDEDEVWELRMGKEAVSAVQAIDASFPDEDYRPGSFFEKLEPGLFWLNPKQRGEGLNLVDFAARNYGPGFTIETGMRQPFANRLAIQKTIVKTAVKIFEERYS